VKMRTKINWSELRGIILVMLGVITMIYYFSWWFEAGRLLSPVLILWFIAAIIYNTFQVLSVWVIYLAAHRRPQRFRAPVNNFTVDVFITACGEDHALVERSLKGACRMRGEHNTWLLDDGDDPRLKEIATKLGAGYLTRKGRQDAKAGNINAALARTDGDIVVIFDIDHVPCPEFLERTLPLFVDPKVGFVQVMLTFENWEDGWIAQAAADTTLDFYNPASIGADRLGSATLIGSNALIRRDALISIERYQTGLAEDLATSIALHAAGWCSIYVPEPLAPGIAPPNLAAWFTQQLKWARGVFELLLTAYPRLFRRLTFGQHISYTVRMTYYWVGLAMALHILLAVLVLWSGSLFTIQAYADYLKHLLPLMVMTMIIRQLALRRWRPPTIHSTIFLFQFKVFVLVAITWPVYTLAWILAVFRVPVTFRPTPKLPGDLLQPLWILPHLVMVILIGLGLGRTVTIIDAPQAYWLPVAFMTTLLAPQLFLPTWWLVEFVRKMFGGSQTLATNSTLNKTSATLGEKLTGPVAVKSARVDKQE